MNAFNLSTSILPPGARAAVLLACLAWPFQLRAAQQPVVTGQVLTEREIVAALPRARTGDVQYAQVNSAWLHKFYSKFRSDLARLGVVKWDERYDCRRFAGMYTEIAQSEFFLQNFHSSSPAHTLALGPIWYLRDDGRGGHAVIVAFTERGRVYIDPQNGEEIRLSAREQASIYLAVI